MGNESTWVAQCSLLSSTDTEELEKYSDPEKTAEAVDVMTLHLGVSPDMPHKNVYAGFQSQSSFLQSPSSAQTEGRLHALVICADEASGMWIVSEFASVKSDLLTLLSLHGSARNFPDKLAQYEAEYPDLYSITLYELIMLLKSNGRLLERPNVSHSLLHYSFQTFSRSCFSSA